MTEQRHVLSILVENRFGELARIVGLFGGRGFNIDSLTASSTVDPQYSRVILETRGDSHIIEQVTKQIHKLVRVRRVHEVSEDTHLTRVLCLATVNVSGAKGREDVERVARLTSARVIAYAQGACTLELTGSDRDVDGFIEFLKPLGIRDLVRSAPMAVPRPGVTSAPEGAEP